MASEACTKLPPVESSYTPAGSYETIAGLKTYKTRESNASRGIIFIYDIFGLHPTTMQGAHRLDQHLNAVVLMPGFFKGAPLRSDIFPLDSDAKKAEIGSFMESQANVEKASQKLGDVIKEAKKMHPSVKSWGVFGLCWGGKVAVLSCGRGTDFKVSGQGHPGRLVVEDATNMSIPHICLFAPEDGTAEIKRDYTEAIKKHGGEAEVYDTMFHGWMGARANLQKEDNAKEFARGYDQVATFFSKHI